MDIASAYLTSARVQLKTSSERLVRWFDLPAYGISPWYEPVSSKQHDVGKQLFNITETRINFGKKRKNCLHYSDPW